MTMDVDYPDHHRRLPSIQNILSNPSAPEPLDAVRRPAYSADPFRPHIPAPPPAAAPIAAAATTTPRYQPIPQERPPPSAAPAIPPLTARPPPVSDDHARPHYTPAAPPPPVLSAYPPYASQSTHTSPSSNAHNLYHTSPSSLDETIPSPEHHESSSSHTSPKQQPRSHQIRPVQGHGDCYIMPDGSYIPVIINGELVNPEFGVTKAGKPRKRLAQACMTCREKKIKCQPGEPKCQQCTKLNRECKRPAPLTGGPKDMPPLRDSKVSIVPVAPRFDPVIAKAASPPPLSKKRSTADLLAAAPVADYTAESHLAAPDVSLHGPKRQRSTGFDQAVGEHTPMRDAYDPRDSRHGDARMQHDKSASMYMPRMPSSFDVVAADMGDIDPFDKDPYLTVELLDLYFLHRGRGMYEVLPRDDFMKWVVECRNKRREDKMVLYIMLAVGSRFCKDRKKKNIGAKFAKKAAFLEKEFMGDNSLQLAQTRLYFLLYCFAEGNNPSGWDYLASGMGTCNALGYNTEEGINDVPADPRDYDYGFSRFQLTEVRRRTFWAGYCMDRFIGHNSGHSCLIHDDDVFVRLPSPESCFQRNIDTQPGPFFSEGQLCDAFAGVPGEMACLVQIVSIWGDVVAHAWRSLHRPNGRHSYLSRFEQHYATTYRRVAVWEDSLPEYLRFNATNTAECVTRERSSLYFVLHTIRFVALIKLNRNGNAQLLPREVQSHNIARAMTEAHNLLTITSMLSRYAQSAPDNVDVQNALSQPFPGYATLAACEVVAAGGTQADRARVHRELTDATAVLEQIGRFWFAGTKQQDKVNRLLSRMDADVLRSYDAGFWRMPATKDALDFFPEHYDLINSAHDDIFFDAVRRS